MLNLRFSHLWILREVSSGTLKIIDVSEGRINSILRVEDLGKQVVNKKQMFLGCLFDAEDGGSTFL
jgi:hypothetical protein